MNGSKLVILAAAFAGTTHAQTPSTNVIFEGSTDNGQTWTGGNMVFPSTPDLLVRVRVQLVNYTLPILGLATVTFQPKAIGWRFTDIVHPFSTPDGTGVAEEPQTNTGRILPFASSNMSTSSTCGLLTTHFDAPSTLRFAGANAVTQTTNLAWGVSCGQVPLDLGGTNFRRGLDVVVFRFRVALDQSDPLNRVVSFTTDASSVVQGQASWYRTVFDGVPVPVTQSSVLPLNLFPVPVPGSLAIFAAAGTAFVRRPIRTTRPTRSHRGL